jgi:hypothetical protein
MEGRVTERTDGGEKTVGLVGRVSERTDSAKSCAVDSNVKKVHSMMKLKGG